MPDSATADDVQDAEPPREGTLAWLQTQEHVDVQGLQLPAVHRVPKDATLLLGDDDGHCRVVKADGKRCGSTRLRLYGICLIHAGGGGFIGENGAAVMSKRAHAVKIARRERRELLGIGSRRAASPRQIARVQAMARAEALAAAIVSAPLDDASLGTIERQKAALAALEATFPLATVSAEVSFPASAEQAASMTWPEMQALAARLSVDS